MNPETLMSLTAGKAMSFDHIPGGARPEWTRKMRRTRARGSIGADTRRRIAGPMTNRCTARSMAVLSATSLLADNESWPARTRYGERYLDRLVRVAIFEEWHTMSVVWSRLSVQERHQLTVEVPQRCSNRRRLK